ncbi:hypothetical protein GCM10020358_44700 [Amorphoplanes nipponensis]|uniref:Uncharacterized protein n=1 Tax=Actinoplanes nipponensis TaxID=135950 RepID=A0A919ML77_9ACTN|nr:hypothetical protein Ani05nite_71930 [Actinoplanes nipponensis]
MAGLLHQTAPPRRSSLEDLRGGAAGVSSKHLAQPRFLREHPRHVPLDASGELTVSSTASGPPARELAGDRTIEVAAGDVGGQVPAAGLIDAVRMDVGPDVFGSASASSDRPAPSTWRRIPTRWFRARQLEGALVTSLLKMDQPVPRY